MTDPWKEGRGMRAELAGSLPERPVTVNAHCDNFLLYYQCLIRMVFQHHRLIIGY
jgi:hypothetical protein